MLWNKKLKKVDKAKEKKLKDDIEREGGLEKNDLKAMVIAAFITILPPCILAIGGIALLTLLIFGLL